MRPSTISVGAGPDVAMNAKRATGISANSHNPRGTQLLSRVRPRSQAATGSTTRAAQSVQSATRPTVKGRNWLALSINGIEAGDFQYTKPTAVTARTVTRQRLKSRPQKSENASRPAKSESFPVHQVPKAGF